VNLAALLQQQRKERLIAAALINGGLIEYPLSAPHNANTPTNLVPGVEHEQEQEHEHEVSRELTSRSYD
jgi:hypothetical protein